MVKRATEPGSRILIEQICFRHFENIITSEEAYIKLPLYKYLNELMSLAKVNDGDVSCTDVLNNSTEKGLGITAFKQSNYLKNLVAVEAIRKTGERKTARFYFDEVSIPKIRTLLSDKIQKSMLARKSPRSGTKIIQEQKSLFEDKGAGIIDGSTQVAFLSDKLFCGIADNVMRDSYRDTRKTIQETLIFGKDAEADRIEIKAVCTSDSESELLAIPDKRLVRVLDSYISSRIKETYANEISSGTFEFSMVKNSFALDVNHLCKEIGISSKGAGPENMRNMIYRLKDTQFQIDADSAPRFMNLISEVRKFIGDDDQETNLFDQNQFDIKYFSRLSHDLSILASKSGKTTRAPRIYLAEVDRLHLGFLCLGIIAKESAHATLMLTHEGLKVDRTVLQKVYDWCKAHIGVRGYNKPTYTWSQFTSKCFSSMRPVNAYKSFLAALREYSKREGLGMIEEFENNKPISIYGYYIEWIGDPETVLAYCKGRRLACREISPGKYRPLLKIWRDREDSLVGDNSFHNRKIQEESDAFYG